MRQLTGRVLSGPASLLDNASRFYGLSLVVTHAIRLCKILLLKKDDALCCTCRYRLVMMLPGLIQRIIGIRCNIKLLFESIP